MSRIIGPLCVLCVLSALSGCFYENFFVPNSIALADINGDGALDILVATTNNQGYFSNPGFANVILNTSATAGVFKTGIPYATTANDPSSIAVADLTGSGSFDMVVANASGSVSVYLHGSVPGTFLPAVDVPTGGTPNQVVIGDVNGDHKPDLVVADISGSGNIIVLLADPAHPGSFQAPATLSTGAVNTSVAIADINGDGAADIVAAGSDANGNNGAVYVFYQIAASPGTFRAPARFAAGAQPQSVKVADVNADTLPDIIVANFGPGGDNMGTSGVSVLLQDATHPGQFLSPVTYATGGQSVDVAVGDLDGDSKPDLVVANSGSTLSGSVSVLLQDPLHAGVYFAATNYSGFGQPISVAIGDLNGDGKPDIAVADATSATVLFQSETSPGTFAPAVQVGN